MNHRQLKVLAVIVIVLGMVGVLLVCLEIYNDAHIQPRLSGNGAVFEEQNVAGNGIFSFIYPAGWIVHQGDGTVGVSPPDWQFEDDAFTFSLLSSPTESQALNESGFVQANTGLARSYIASGDIAGPDASATQESINGNMIIVARVAMRLYDVNGYAGAGDGWRGLIIGENRYVRFDAFEVGALDEDTFNSILKSFHFKPGVQVLDNGWSKDQMYVYYKGVPVVGADPATFKTFGNGNFGYDQYHVYEIGAYLMNASTSDPIIIPGIDAASFIILKEHPQTAEDLYAKDRNGVYIDEGDTEAGFIKINDADPATFQLLGSCSSGHGIASSYAKDKNHVYCGGDIIAGVDLSSFQFIGVDESFAPEFNPGVAKDKACIYRSGVKVVDAKGACFDPSGCVASALASDCGGNYGKP